MILTDTRALDTLGEVVVLLAVAVGILTLTRRRAGGAVRAGAPDPVPDSTPDSVTTEVPA